MSDDTNIQNGMPACESQDCCKKDQEKIAMQLADCSQQVTEWKDKYLRLTADLDNLNRRAAKDRALSLHNAQVALLFPLLSIVDDFERALENKPAGIDDQWLNGISMMYAALIKYLQSVGVESMKVYEQFDPEQHEALMYGHAEDKPEGSIIAVLQKGYLLKGEVLRHAKVSVAK